MAFYPAKHVRLLEMAISGGSRGRRGVAATITLRRTVLPTAYETTRNRPPRMCAGQQNDNPAGACVPYWHMAVSSYVRRRTDGVGCDAETSCYDELRIPASLRQGELRSGWIGQSRRASHG